jgi:hypothetical protein
LNYKRLYEYRFENIDPVKKLAVWREIATKVYQMMEKPKRILDPAGGQLEFIGQIDAPERWVVDLVEHDSVARKDGLKYVVANIFDADLPQNYFDGVFISNFLEHLRSQEEVATLLEKMHSVMSTGGTIAIMGPNFKYTYECYFDFADHIVPLTHLSVAEHLYAAGFTLKAVVPKFVPYSFRSRLPASSFLVSWYLKLPFFWRFLGKQFLIIAEKR